MQLFDLQQQQLAAGVLGSGFGPYGSDKRGKTDTVFLYILRNAISQNSRLQALKTKP